MDDATPVGYSGAGYQMLCRFQAVASGNMTEFKVKCYANGTIAYAVYADSSGSPGARLAQQATPQAVVSGWNTLPIASVSLTSGSYYWLAVYIATGDIGYNTSGGTRKYKAGASTFPDPFDNTGFGDDSIQLFEAGWGVLVLSPSSIVQSVSYGSPKLNLSIKPSSIVQAIAYGTPTVQVGAGGLSIQPSSIVQSIAIGTPKLILSIKPSSIVQAIAIGTPKLILFIKPSSIVQLIAIGTPIVKKPDLYESYLEESAYYNVWGIYWRSQSFTPQSSHIITSVKIKLCRVGSPGTGTISIKATDANGKPTGADLCSASIDGNSLPTDPTLLGFSLGAGANLSAGTKYAIVWRFPSGNSSNYARTRHMYPGTYAGGTAVESSDSGATWSVVTDWDFVFQDWGESLAQTVYPSSTIQPITYGTPEVSIWGILKPPSIVQQIIIGTPTVEGGIPAGLLIFPPSIVQQISLGSPTLLKFVWHVILDGQYLTATPPTNRAYVIGRDIYGNPVYGTAVDSTELGLVGERLDFQQELAIPTESQAADVANAILSKMRLTGKRGVILIPPNCGQELFDVVQITDAGANQSAIKFRVVGLRFEYSPKQARYQHRLILGAP